MYWKGYQHGQAIQLLLVLEHKVTMASFEQYPEVCSKTS